MKIRQVFYTIWIGIRVFLEGQKSFLVLFFQIRFLVFSFSFSFWFQFIQRIEQKFLI